MSETVSSEGWIKLEFEWWSSGGRAGNPPRWFLADKVCVLDSKPRDVGSTARNLPPSVDYHGGVGDVDLLVDYGCRLLFGRRLSGERVVV